MDRLNFIQLVLLSGIVATAVLDLWQGIASWVFGLPRSNWALVGRWVSHIPRGKLVHDAIGKAAPARYEEIVGWVTHYVVGIAYAALYLGFTASSLAGNPASGPRSVSASSRWRYPGF